MLGLIFCFRPGLILCFWPGLMFFSNWCGGSPDTFIFPMTDNINKNMRNKRLKVNKKTHTHNHPSLLSAHAGTYIKIYFRGRRHGRSH